MTGGIKQKICYLQQIDDIDMLDIGLVKKYALNCVRRLGGAGIPQVMVH